MLKKNKQLIIQISLFLLTIFTTTMAGLEWLGRSVWMEDFQWSEFSDGFAFSFPFLLILTVHEFGHYFTAQYYKVKVTLPYYIPMWLPGLTFSIGTMGAFIKIKDHIQSRKEYFDIGIAGPLAGFVVAVLVLYIGFTTLPPPEYIFEIHPEYEQWGLDYPDHAYEDNEGISFQIGPTIMFWLFENYVADPTRVPNANEVSHYPMLFAGYLALFFTALNLLPIGQLDGGHILYGLMGAKWHRRIASTLFVVFVTYAGIGIINPHDLDTLTIYHLGYPLVLYYSFYSMTPNRRVRVVYLTVVVVVQLSISLFFPNIKGYSGWLVFAFLIGRFLGVHHPPVIDDRPLSTGRKVLGWLALVVFVLCFSPSPFGAE